MFVYYVCVPTTVQLLFEVHFFLFFDKPIERVVLRKRTLKLKVGKRRRKRVFFALFSQPPSPPLSLHLLSYFLLAEKKAGDRMSEMYFFFRFVLPIMFCTTYCSTGDTRTTIYGSITSF